MKRAKRTRRRRRDEEPAGQGAGRGEGQELVLEIVGTAPPEEGGGVALRLAAPATVKGRLIDRDELGGVARILIENVVLKVPLLGGVPGAEAPAPVEPRRSSTGCLGE